MRYLLTLLILLSFIYSNEPDAVLKIEKSVDQRASIALVSASAIVPQYKREANRIFRADLTISGNFLVDQNSLSAPFSSLPVQLHAKSKYLLLYNFAATPGGGASLDVKLFATAQNKMILRKNYTVSRLEKAPFLIHKAVSEIDTALKYPPIEWINRYVVTSRYIGPKKSEILLSDYTFTYKKIILKGGLNLFPKWADKNQRELYYSSYGKDSLTLYKLNIYTGAKEKIITTSGMLACTDVSRDGNRLLLTMAPSSQPDIYLYVNGATKQLTTFSGIDVSGKFIENEQSIVFVSNRLGSPNIFKKSLNGGGVQKLVNHGMNNSSCDTYGTKVVYSSKESQKSYNIYLTNSSGEEVRPLTSGGINHFPRFSSDGNIVMYIKRTPTGNRVGYLNLSANRSQSFALGISKIQSIDW